jgi:FkbM family methyltransferase
MDIKLNDYSVAECIHGIMIWPKNDSVIGPCLNKYGEWAEGENIIMSNYINEGDTVIDVGANLGTTVLSMSKEVGVSGKVIAFEPQQIMSQCLNTTLSLNGISNVHVYTMAVSNQNNWTYINDNKFTEIGRYGEAGISENGTNGTRIKTITLDELDVDKCDLVKIDIEGHEWEAVQGGQKFLNKHKPVMYMEAKRSEIGTKKYIKWLMDNGWICYWHFASWFREKNYYQCSENDLFPNVGDMNILAIHKTKNQTNDLLRLEKFDEEWSEQKLRNFYHQNNLEII